MTLQLKIRRLLKHPGWWLAGVLMVLPWLLFVTLDKLVPLQMPEHQSRHFAQVVVDAQGEPLRVFPDGQGVWRYPVTVQEVSPLYIEALLTYEDRWFYSHPGINPLAMLRAGGQWLVHRRVVSGGSTITMQVARILHLHRRTVAGKAYQMFRALQLERHYSKDQILTLYLNHAPFGGTVEGVQAASFAYLGKPARSLSHAEAALLAVLPQRPTALRPDRDPQRATLARDKVIERMAEFNVWSRWVAEEALAEPLAPRMASRPLLAPLLAERLARANPDRSLIHTTIDAGLQQQVQTLVADYIQSYAEQTSAAVLVVDNRDLSVRAYQGSAVYASEGRLGYVDMVQAVRSPGSTLKPFLYAMAMDEGLIHSESLLLDVPSNFNGYQPTNFHSDFSGPVSVSQALRSSLNVPAVQVLAELGPETFYARLANAGVTPRMPIGSRPNLSLVLGGAGVTLEELASAYTSLGRQGMAGRLRLQPESPVHQRRMLSEQAAWVVQDSLRAPLERSGRLYRHSQTRIPAVAHKTGTSYGYRDAWAVAVTEQLTVAVWVGRPDGTALPHNTGRFSAVPLLERLLNLMPARELAPPRRPEAVQWAAICWPLGTLSAMQTSAQCHNPRHAWLIDGVAPPTLRDPMQRAGDSLNQQVALDHSGDYRVTPGCAVPAASSQAFALWPASLEPWLPETWLASARLPPLHESCAESSQPQQGRLVIKGVEPGSTLSPGPGARSLPGIVLEAVGVQGRGYWFLNGQRLGVTVSEHRQLLENLPRGSYRLSVVDDAGKSEQLDFLVAGVDERAGRVFQL